MAYEDSPSSVLYAEMKALGLSNRDTAMVLLDTSYSLGGVNLVDRIESRPQLSRTIVHVAPGEMSPRLFKDFGQSSQVLMGRIVARMRKDGSRDAAGELLQRFTTGESSQNMQQALRDYNLDDSLYRNALAYISGLKLEGNSDRAHLCLMLFVVTGCTGDPAKGAQAVEQFSANRVGASFRTTEDHVNLDATIEEAEDDYNLGLMRIVGGRLKGADAFYQLNPTEQGTEIGALSSEKGAITDVDADVSRHHARIYKQGSHWYIVGLKSTNGTTVISGADKIEHVVEPPKRERPRTYVPEPFEIFPTDTICLGSSTRFMVMPMM